MVSGGLTLGMAKGNGARAISGPKKRQPKRSFSTRQSCPLMRIGRKKDVGWPTPAKGKPTSKTKRNSSGPSTIAARRKSQRRAGGVEAGAVLAAGVGGDERLDRDGFIFGAASSELPPGSSP